MKKENIVGMYGKYGGQVWVNVPGQGTKNLYFLPYQHNLIVNDGRTWINKRLAFDNGDSGFLTKVVALQVGTGSTQPVLANQSLGVATITKTPTTNSIIGTPNYQSKFSAVLTAAEINSTTEVGIFTSAGATTGTMVARNVHSSITLPLGSSITFDYIIGITTSKTVSGWSKTLGKNYTYEVLDSVPAGGVIEWDTYNGYKPQTSIANVDANAGSYYNDGTKTYIRCTDNADMTLATPPHTILILSRM